MQRLRLRGTGNGEDPSTRGRVQGSPLSRRRTCPELAPCRLDAGRLSWLHRAGPSATLDKALQLWWRMLRTATACRQGRRAARACRTMASMPPLRVRSGADIHLADAFGLPGLPAVPRAPTGPRPRTSSRSCPRASTTSRSARRSTRHAGSARATPGRCSTRTGRGRAASGRRSCSGPRSWRGCGTLRPPRRTRLGAVAARRRRATRHPPARPASGLSRPTRGRSRRSSGWPRTDDWARGGGRRAVVPRAPPRAHGRAAVPAGMGGGRGAPGRAPRGAARPAGGVRPCLRARPPASPDRRPASRPSTRPRTSSAGRRRRGPPAAASPGVPADGVAAVLLTGVYGSGKTTLAIEIVDRLDDAGVHAAAIDLDWLGWYGAPTDWDEHDDPRLTLEHLALMATRYVGRRRPAARPGRDDPARDPRPVCGRGRGAAGRRAARGGRGHAAPPAGRGPQRLAPGGPRPARCADLEDGPPRRRRRLDGRRGPAARRARDGRARPPGLEPASRRRPPGSRAPGRPTAPACRAPRARRRRTR